MAKVEGVNRVIESLRRQARDRLGRYGARVRASVVYEAPYAIYVHENLEARHAPPTQAKFLEQPARQNAAAYAAVIADAMRRGATLAEAVYQGALRLLRDSQALCPVDTGHLRSSGTVVQD